MAQIETGKLFQRLTIDTHKSSPARTSPSIADSSIIDQPYKETFLPLSSSRIEPINRTTASDFLSYNDAEQGIELNGHRYRSQPIDATTGFEGVPCEPGRAERLAALESSFRNRTTSISFSPEVKLDTGNNVSLKAPHSKPQNIPRPRGRSIIAELCSDETNGRVSPRRSHSDPAFALQQSDSFSDGLSSQARHRLSRPTVDTLGRDPTINEDERLASLTSETTASSVPEEVQTPPDMSSSLLLSPLTTSSPICVPASASSFPRRPGSVRSRSERSDLSRQSSLRRAGRRQSTRSAASSKSPASQFLSMWSPREDRVANPEPDEEGQEIGDHSGYIIGAQVGIGGFSVVKEVSTFEGEKWVRRAVKIVRKRVMGKEEDENEKLQTEFEHEVSVWRFLKHPYILPLLAVYESPFATFCITQLITGGTLFDLIQSRRKSSLGGLPADLARRYVYQLASAIRYLHEDVRVVHRDIKLENVLLDLSAPDARENGGSILLCDFGMADFIHNETRQWRDASDQDIDPKHSYEDARLGPSQTSISVTGSLRYAAPELINTSVQLYSTAVDIWALGCVIYALVTARYAFPDPYEPRLINSIQRAEWDIQALYDSNAAQDDPNWIVELVSGCLECDPLDRWDIADVLASPWFDGYRELYEDVDCAWVA